MTTRTLDLHYYNIVHTSHINKKIIKSINGFIQVDIKNEIDGDVNHFHFLTQNNTTHTTYARLFSSFI